MTIPNEEVVRIAAALAAKLLAEAETKRIFKEAIDEWCEKKYNQFNASVVRKLWIALFAALITFTFWTQGYHR